MSKSALCIIGGGNMGSALVRGLLAGGFDETQLTIVEKDASQIAALKKSVFKSCYHNSVTQV